MPIVSKEEFLSRTYDFVIVGGGTSGLVVAARLSEDPTLTVGVLEAGVDHAGDPAVDIPGLMARNTRDPKYDWEFYTEPQVFVNGRRMQESRGKGLGGSSMLNMCAFVRPSKEEIDGIERLGNPGWGWDDVSKYMQKSECYFEPQLTPEQTQELSMEMDTKVHGSKGPISVSFPSQIPPLHKEFLGSCEALGVGRNTQPNGGKIIGSFFCAGSVDPTTGTRSYAASGYLAPNLHRQNLFVLIEAYATKINFEKDSSGLQLATSVEFIKDEERLIVGVTKEVILSAGTFQTPQILENSAIGNARILEPLGIQPIVDLPGVGENLQDHTHVPAVVEIDPSSETLEMLDDLNQSQINAHRELYKQQKGILAGIPYSAFIFLPASTLAREEDVKRWVTFAAVEASPAEVFKDTPSSVVNGIHKQYELIREWLTSPLHPFSLLLHINGHFPVLLHTPDSSKRYCTFLCGQTHPFSRGSVHIKSLDPKIPPAIQPNYLSNRADLDILMKSVRFTQQMFRTAPVKDQIIETVVPLFDLSDGDLEERVRELLTTIHHPVGTASMLPRELGGVVDPDLKVYETTNVRVADCSIIPLQVSSNTVTMAYAIGEKAADIIRSVL
ncbi:hypothetical protein D9758_003546 [Tetrapyrgos nigripes]|uniref:Glucose-methanol-choline oxidoreductase N-terminal domain-containing protein n=1 Tax=Tetrapyrgos nigripes TaxID=182062 RepID=A0A8H5GVF8_9AGAR|nr:hypothetical protein D9758_003546 [Tetrapyrgos nigripes]